MVTNTRTNESGVFVFPSLAPGVYTVRIQREGFRPLAYSDITLEIGARMRLNAVLTVGEVT